jgi:hypothetical protein
LKVTDLDLAGIVQTPELAGLTDFFNLANLRTKDYRIVIAIDVLRMALSHELMDVSDQILQQEVKLKEIVFFKSMFSHKNASLSYEK